MNSRTIAVMVVFAALTIVLNLSPFKIPAPYAPFLIYQIWEIPIVSAFLLFGVYVGMAISVINTAMLLAVFPGDLPTGPFYNLAAVISMLLGIYLVRRFRASNAKNLQGKVLVSTVLFTAAGLISRVAVMTLVNWAFLPFPPPLGFGLPVDAVVASLPIIGFFNATLALYTIPIGDVVANIVGSRMQAIGWVNDQG